MADRSQGSIQIGGKVKRELLPLLLHELKGYELLEDYCTADDLEPDPEGFLAYTDDEATGGMFEDLEDFLCKNKIDYDRQSAPSYYYEADNVSYRDGKGWSFSKDATYDLRSRIKEELLATIDAGNWDMVKSFIERNGPPPPLEPFTIVD